MIFEENTKKRLQDIESELTNLREKQEVLQDRWKNEKVALNSLRMLKERLEEAKQSAVEYERLGDYGKVAEIRYGVVIDLEKQIALLNAKLEETEQSQRLLKEEIGVDDIAEVVAKWTGIPVQKMLETERVKLLGMEDRLHRRVVSQGDAVRAVANAIRRSRAGLQDSKRPIGSFIFLGTTGVGKTEMARALAEFLFDDENALVRIDMSEYMEKFSVSRLVGAPPGYVGYDEGGQLTEAVRNHPYCVLLLDEIEKAHSDVFNILLQVLDDGRLTDSKGRIVNFKNTIIIMTSNLGTDVIQEKIADIRDDNRDEILGGIRSKIIDLLRKTMRPEFLNRIDEVVLFKPLTASEVREIAVMQCDKLTKTLAANNITLTFDAEATDWIARVGYDPQYGARPLRRAIQRYIADQLAVKLLSGEFAAGDAVRVTASDNGGIDFAKQ